MSLFAVFSCMYVERRKARRKASEQSLFRFPPLPEESIHLHKLFLESTQFEQKHDPNRSFHPASVVLNMDVANIESSSISSSDFTYMNQTLLSSTRLFHPQDRNVYNFIFGGILMREAFELAFCNAFQFCQSRPYLLSVEETTFKLPVPIGSLASFTSQIVYAENKESATSICMVKVQTSLLDVTTRKCTPSNSFMYTFEKRVGTLSALLPTTYNEAIMYLEAKRRRESGLQEKMDHLFKWIIWIDKILESK
jgi:acyl-coenzyme A thioesterase 9